MTLVLVHDPFIIIFSYTLLKGSLTVTCPFASILSALITISKTHTSSPLGIEGVVMSISEMKLKRKSVSIDTKLAAIKLLGEGNSVREVAFKLGISIGTVQKAKKKQDDLLMKGKSTRSMKMARLNTGWYRNQHSIVEMVLHSSRNWISN